MSTSARRPRLPLARALACAVALAAALALLAGTARAADAPTITAVAPGTGPLAGGTDVTITGTGFAAGASVTFGSTPAAAVTVVSATSITATTPPHASGPVVVTVTNPDGQGATISNGFRFLGPPPTLTAITPDTGPTAGGNTVTLTGTEFASGASVTIGGRAATEVSVTNATTLTARAPWGEAGGADVVITNADGQSATLPGAYTYALSPPPAVTSVSPTSGTSGGGTRVVITGTNFAHGATVRFGNASATGVTFVSATRIEANAPSGTASTTVSVTVRNADSQGGTLAAAYSYVATPAPTVKSVSPDAGSLEGGQAVTVTGTNFLEGAAVAFGGTAGTVLSVSPTSIVVLTPARTAAGKVGVVVTNTDGKNATLANAYTYQKGPAVTAIAPKVASTSGGGEVTLTGTGFSTTVTVLVGGVAATNVAVTGATKVTFAPPPAPPGAQPVSVLNADGQAAASPEPLLYVAPAVISQVAPLFGSDQGGTPIVISGSGFVAGAKVYVGDAEATAVVVVGGTQITALTPPGTGAGRVRVVGPDGVEGDSAFDFLYTASVGKFSAGVVPSKGMGLVVFSGGTNDALVGAGIASGCPAAARLAFFASDGKGGLVSLLPLAPSVVNGAWNARFPTGVPAGTPLLVRCS